MEIILWIVSVVLTVAIGYIVYMKLKSKFHFRNMERVVEKLKDNDISLSEIARAINAVLDEQPRVENVIQKELDSELEEKQAEINVKTEKAEKTRKETKDTAKELRFEADRVEKEGIETANALKAEADGAKKRAKKLEEYDEILAAY